jgi:hypothetical protein
MIKKQRQLLAICCSIALKIENVAASHDSFKFEKRSQLFIRTQNETLSVAAMCICKFRLFVPENQLLRPSPNSNLLS